MKICKICEWDFPSEELYKEQFFSKFTNNLAESLLNRLNTSSFYYEKLTDSELLECYEQGYITTVNLLNIIPAEARIEAVRSNRTHGNLTQDDRQNIANTIRRSMGISRTP